LRYDIGHRFPVLERQHGLLRGRYATIMAILVLLYT
jgi:hypothetical protein